MSKQFPIYIVWYDGCDDGEVFSSYLDALECYAHCQFQDRCLMRHDSDDSLPVELLAHGSYSEEAV